MRWHGNIQRCGRFIAKIGWYGEPLLLNFRFGIGYKLMKGHRMHGDTLFNQAKEEHTAMSGFAAVEPERKLLPMSSRLHLTDPFHLATSISGTPAAFTSMGLLHLSPALPPK